MLQVRQRHEGTRLPLHSVCTFQIADKHIDAAHKDKFANLIRQAIKVAEGLGDGEEHEANSFLV